MADESNHICESCHAGCCRAFAVPVTGDDILRIERDIGLEFWDFVCRWADKDGQIARNHAPHFHFSDEPQTPFVICLAQEQSLFLGETAKCRFLVECPPDDEAPTADFDELVSGGVLQKMEDLWVITAEVEDMKDLVVQERERRMQELMGE